MCIGKSVEIISLSTQEVTNQTGDKHDAWLAHIYCRIIRDLE